MNNIKIGIASDHRGFTAKEFLKEYFDENDIYVIDFGTNSAESVDFPVYAKKLGEAIQNEEIDLGIAICGTGIGMSIVLNKMKGVYCAKVSNESEAILCKSHNNANVIAMSEEIDHEVMKKIVNNFIETPFSNVSKYIRRNNMIKEIENDVKEELGRQGINIGNPQTGIMIETPAAVMISDELAKKVDFFSIGTNDLTQYTLAVDRQNSKLDAFFDPHHPAVLKMIQMVIDSAHKEGIWAGICGELGADTTLTEQFVAMGIDELSVSPAMVLPVRERVVGME